MSERQRVLRGIELFNQLLELQSAKDGVPRPLYGVIDPVKVSDSFAREVHEAQLYHLHLLRMIPQIKALTELGRHLEKQSLITVPYGDDYAEAALHHYAHAADVPISLVLE